jgi:hypothetical protein
MTFGGLKTKLGCLNTKLGCLKARIGGLKTKLGGHKTKLGGQKTKLGGLKTLLAGLTLHLIPLCSNKECQIKGRQVRYCHSIWALEAKNRGISDLIANSYSVQL